MGKSKSSNGDIYHSLRSLWKAAYPLKTGKVVSEEFLAFWKENKNDRLKLEEKIKMLQLKKMASENSIIRSFAKVSSKSTPPATHDEPAPTTESAPCSTEDIQVLEQLDGPSNSEEIEGGGVSSKTSKRERPAQTKTKEKIDSLKDRIFKLQVANSAGLLTPPHKLELKKLRKEHMSETKKLKRLKQWAKGSRKHYRKERAVLKSLQQDYPKEVQLQDGPGRPSLDRDQPDLQDTILQLVNSFCTADEKRNSECLRTMKTLDDLLFALRNEGYSISRAGLYLRFQPRRCDTAHGRQHVKPLPIRLIKAYNNQRKSHIDSHFAAGVVKYLKDLAVLFGSNSVFVLSQDDKARVPLGLPAANKQGPILMKLDYKVKLPDHDWVIATKHKLIPSVYAALAIEKHVVSYSGPTYIAIRSGKHDSSTAYSHAKDIEKLLSLDSFVSFAGAQAHPKPIWIIFVDGGPDENPRFPKTLQYAVQHFKANNLDGLFIATHAPHQSASNPVERRMAPLSKDLCGIILPHDAFGNHLDSNGKTIDNRLEIQNFEKAGNVLAEIWKERVIDGYNVETEYVPPTTGYGSTGTDSINQGYVVKEEPSFLTEMWKHNHVRQSQYCLQIVKCNNLSCCSAPTTNLRGFLHGQFLPTPVKFLKSTAGIALSSDIGHGSFLDLPTRLSLSFLIPPTLQFDTFCPSLSGKLEERTCAVCQSYFVTKKALLSHKKLHRVNLNDGKAYLDENYDDPEETTEQASNNITHPNIHLITDMVDWLQPIFE